MANNIILTTTIEENGVTTTSTCEMTPIDGVYVPVGQENFWRELCEEVERERAAGNPDYL